MTLLYVILSVIGVAGAILLYARGFSTGYAAGFSEANRIRMQANADAKKTENEMRDVAKSPADTRGSLRDHNF